MEREYSSYKMNDNIKIVVDDNPDDINSHHGLHCHVVKVNRGRVASICLPSCRYSSAPNKDDLSFKEQNKVLKYCEGIKDKLVSDCNTVLLKGKKWTA